MNTKEELQSCREAFERWAKNLHLDIEIATEGDYKGLYHKVMERTVELAWDAWASGAAYQSRPQDGEVAQEIKQLNDFASKIQKPWTLTCGNTHERGIRNKSGFICFATKVQHWQGQDERFVQESAESNCSLELMVKAPRMLEIINELSASRPHEDCGELVQRIEEYLDVIKDASSDKLGIGKLLKDCKQFLTNINPQTKEK